MCLIQINLKCDCKSSTIWLYCKSIPTIPNFEVNATTLVSWYQVVLIALHSTTTSVTCTSTQLRKTCIGTYHLNNLLLYFNTAQHINLLYHKGKQKGGDSRFPWKPCTFMVYEWTFGRCFKFIVSKSMV